MQKLADIKQAYFLGIGGIGMSALARYFASQGIAVSGYDRTSTELTLQLEKEGIAVHYQDNPQLLPSGLNVEDSLIVYTPAVPANHQELNFLIDLGFIIHKRAEVLGIICNSQRTIAVAGTHGKTSVSTMTAHILKSSVTGCSAFLGGISKNYQTNLLIDHTGSPWIVAEADEFDRSFLQLKPELAVITSMDADHLDIYGSHEKVIESFRLFAGKVKEGGSLVLKKGLSVSEDLQNIRIFNYSITEEADFCAENVTLKEGFYQFDLKTPELRIEKLVLNYPGLLNVENAVAASALAILAGVSPDEIRSALASYSGVKRRFDIQLNNGTFVLIDDYAHHPEEMRATIQSVRDIYKGRTLTGIFQPHLYSRTKDFASSFAKSLDLLDEVVLLDIYPARELPMEGVTSELIFNQVTNPNKRLCNKKELAAQARSFKPGIVLMMGAGDIDTLVQPVKEQLLKNENS
ncbi:MAG TPA: UDP-N-acetylmuramate--L-alanine ligase [Prolixibacteraceae bacterium]|jgi:UDP-N-acetylmuramate--alanine ligase|nr:UDP-N-acetylmuramate--L-alanine ligase [Prolixibacteraceae bacterium]